MARILVIDDDLLLIRGITRILAAKNHVVTPAFNGADGMDLAREESPDLVLTDITMPHGGLPAIGALRDEFSDLPIIAMSGNAYILDDAVSLGAQALLPKPFTLVDLVRVVEATLAASPRQATSSAGQRSKPRLAVQRPKPSVGPIASR